MRDFAAFVYDVRGEIRRDVARRRLARRRRRHGAQLLAHVQDLAGWAILLGTFVAVGAGFVSSRQRVPRLPPRSRPHLEDTVRVIPVPPPAPMRRVPRGGAVIA